MWWDNDAKLAARRVKQAHTIWRKNRTNDNHERLKKERKDYRKCIRVAKRESWKKFLDSRATCGDTAKLNKILNTNKLSPMGLLTNPSGEVYEPKESIEHLADVHFPGSKKEIPKRTFNRKKCDISTAEISYITTEKIFQVSTL